MSDKLRIIPLGGLNEIGKNMTVLEYGKDMIVVDCGLGFPEDDMYGVDLVIPDVTYLVNNQKKLRGYFITQIVADGVNALRSPEKSAIIITHYQKLLEYVQPDVVHVLKDGRIVRTGGREVIDAIEKDGFDQF